MEFTHNEGMVFPISSKGGQVEAQPWPEIWPRLHSMANRTRAALLESLILDRSAAEDLAVDAGRQVSRSLSAFVARRYD